MAAVTKKRVKKPTPKTTKKVANKKRPVKRSRKTAPTAVARPTILEPTLPPPLPVETEHQFQSVERPSSRLKMWLAVLVSMAVIVCFWAYSLTQTLLSSNAISESADSTNIDDFVSSLSDDLSQLKTGSDVFVDQTKDQPNPNEVDLDSLFSDIE